MSEAEPVPVVPARQAGVCIDLSGRYHGWLRPRLSPRTLLSNFLYFRQPHTSIMNKHCIFFPPPFPLVGYDMEFFKCLIATFFSLRLRTYSHVPTLISGPFSYLLVSFYLFLFVIHTRLYLFSQPPVLHKVIFCFIALLHSVVGAVFFLFVIIRDLVLVFSG